MADYVIDAKGTRVEIPHKIATDVAARAAFIEQAERPAPAKPKEK